MYIGGVFTNNIYGDLMEALYVLVLSLGSYIVLFALSKLMGYRALSELSFLDYVVGITIGSIGAEMATNVDKSWWRGLIAMTVFAFSEIALSYLTRKSTKARSFVAGKPIIIMSNGEIDRNALKKAQIDINDLLTQAREQGYFALSDIDYAIMENNGKISFLPTPLKRPLSPKDFNINADYSGLCTNLIIDGQIVNENLVYAGVSADKLNKILKERNLKPEEILLLTYDEAGNVEIFENKKSTR